MSKPAEKKKLTFRAFVHAILGDRDYDPLPKDYEHLQQADQETLERLRLSRWAMNGWISTEDIDPEEGELVYVLWAQEPPSLLLLEDGTWYMADGREWEGPAPEFWRALPERPEELD